VTATGPGAAAEDPRIGRARASAGIALLALQQIEDDLTGLADPETLAEILRELFREDDPQGVERKQKGERRLRREPEHERLGQQERSDERRPRSSHPVSRTSVASQDSPTCSKTKTRVTRSRRPAQVLSADILIETPHQF